MSYDISRFILARYEREEAIRRQLAAPSLAPSVTTRPGELTGGVVHITDLNDFCRCKRVWNWSSQLRRGLQPAISPVPLFFGSAIHLALDHGYRGCIGGPVASFDVKAAIHSFKEWMKQHVKLTVEYTGALWEFEKETISEARSLGLVMLRHYAQWAAPLDKMFRVLGMEYKFRVPLPGFEEHGMEYAGRFDGLVQDVQSGTKYILEFKTAKSIRSRNGKRSSNIAGVLRGMQAAAYSWASGQVYDEPVGGVLYRFLLKKEPGMPVPLKTGGYSQAKSIKSTDGWYNYILNRVAAARRDDMIREAEASGPDADSLVPSLEELLAEELAMAHGALSVLRQRNEYAPGGAVVFNDFFLQLPVVKKAVQLNDAMTCLVEEGRRMTDPNQVIYPTPGFHCNWCSFRTPCDLITYGHEDAVEAVLDANYGPRRYWEPEIAEEY